MSKGIVYILTNPCLDGWVKIGMTDREDIDLRLAELNRPENIPLSFRAYAIYEVENPYAVEQSIHKIIDKVDSNLHAREYAANGKVRQREFFKMSEEDAYDIFLEISKLRGDTEALKQIIPTEEQEEEDEIQGRAAPFTFDMVGIQIGTELEFINDASIRCTVVDNRKVQYEGVKYYLSGLAQKLTGLASLAGPWYFTFEGENLGERRQRLVGDYK